MEAKIKFISVDVALLRPNPWNTNKVPPANMDKLKNSMSRLGSFKPVIVRDMGDFYQILGGEHRWQAAVEMGWSTIPVANLGHIDTTEAQQISVIDNERYGEDDAVEFQRLLEEIQSGLDYDFSEIAPFSDDLDAIVPTTLTSSFDELDRLSDSPEPVIEREKGEKTGAAHQTMRFRVGFDVAGDVSRLIEHIIKEQDIRTGNPMEDAGEALVWLVEQYKEMH